MIGFVQTFRLALTALVRNRSRSLLTMLGVAGGRRTLEEFTSLLEGRPRSDAGRTAPAHGLALASVSYGASPPSAAGAGNGAVTRPGRGGPYPGLDRS